MPSVQAAMLCNAASVEQSGLVSMLGAFIDNISGPQFPIRHQLWLVARVQWNPGDEGRAHTLVVQVAHPDGEELFRVEGGAAVGEGSDPTMPSGGNLVVPLLLDVRRPGIYQISLSMNGEPLWVGPLKIETQLPQI